MRSQYGINTDKLYKLHISLIRKGFSYTFPFPNREGTMTRHGYIKRDAMGNALEQAFINERLNGYHNITR